MKIEMGKEYETREGLPVRIYATDGEGLYCIHGAIKMGEEWFLETWTIEGKYDSAEAFIKKDLVEKKKEYWAAEWEVGSGEVVIEAYDCETALAAHKLNHGQSWHFIRATSFTF